MVDPVKPVTTSEKQIRVFIVDDHELVRRGLIDLLSATDDLIIVGEAATAGDALRRIPAVAPDVALLDARLPDGSGIDVCREIRSSQENVRCLILTSYDDDEALFAAVMAGASGYLLKQTGGNSLVEGIRQVAAGRSLLDPAVTEKLLDRLRNPVAADPLADTLTAREREILDLIADGCTNRQIGERLFLAEKTVKNYVSGLLTKLGMQRRTQAAVYGANLRKRTAAPLRAARDLRFERRSRAADDRWNDERTRFLFAKSDGRSQRDVREKRKTIALRASESRR